MKTLQQFILESTNRIGKEIGGSTYVHVNYVKNHSRIPIDQLDSATEILRQKHPDHKYNIVRYGYTGKDKGSFSFINSPDFDTSPEPISGDAIRVNTNGETKVTKQKIDPQIYHHKHEWVGDDYTGFDVNASKTRSKKYNEIIDKLKETNPNIRSRMGTRSVWDKEVLPHLKENNSLDVKTPSIEQIAKKHNVPVQEILNALKDGIDIEHEHSTNKNIAKKIALDHLHERPDYYKKLKKYVE